MLSNLEAGEEIAAIISDDIGQRLYRGDDELTAVDSRVTGNYVQIQLDDGRVAHITVEVS